jgi:hypothetical protein
MVCIMPFDLFLTLISTASKFPIHTATKKPRNLLRGLYLIELVFKLIQQFYMPRNRYRLLWD